MRYHKFADWEPGDLLPGRGFRYAYDAMGNRTTASVSTLGASFADWATDESGSSQTISYSATNELNQYEVIQRPNPLLRLVQGFAHPDATVEITLSGGEAGETVSQSLRWGPGLAAFAAQAAVTLNAQAGWRRVFIKASRPGLGAGGETVSITRDGWLFFPPVNETLSYDLDGNLTADARWTYGWDGDNRLIWMEEKPIAGTGPRPPRQRLEYDYDSQSRRIAKRVLRKTHEMGDWSLHQHRQFLYDGWNMIAEIDISISSGTARLHRSYAWGLDASGTRTGAGGVGGLLLTTHYATPGSGTSSNVTLAPLYDLNSNVLAYADVTTSTITHRIDYDPFGNELTLDTLLPTAAAEEAPRFRFSTKYTDSESGLVYYGFRSYSPELGRWVNRDPIEERGGVNLYGMVGNDPVNRVDYLGQIDCSELSIQAFNRCMDNTSPWEYAEYTDRQNLAARYRYCQDYAQSVFKKCEEERSAESAKCACLVVGGVGLAYGAYRVCRMVPSLFPPLWWTIPGNLAMP